MTSLYDLMIRTPGLPCRLDPDTWFSDYDLDRRYATRQCGGCPLLLACRLYALETEQRWGVWGGVDMTAVVTHCGSDRGYQIHVRNGETVCEPCRVAHDTAVEADRRRRLAEEHARGGSVRGYWTHRKLGEEACLACKRACAQQSKARRERARAGAGRPRSASGSSGAATTLRGPHAGAQPLPIAS